MSLLSNTSLAAKVGAVSAGIAVVAVFTGLGMGVFAPSLQASAPNLGDGDGVSEVEMVDSSGNLASVSHTKRQSSNMSKTMKAEAPGPVPEEHEDPQQLPETTVDEPQAEEIIEEYVPADTQWADYGGEDEVGDTPELVKVTEPYVPEYRSFGMYDNVPVPDEDARRELEDFSWVTYDTFARLDKEGRIKLAGRMAQVDQRRTGILASVTMAQMILESGWMESGLAQYENYFGIKASPLNNNWNNSTWGGYVVYMGTQEEYVEGELVNITDGFRVYNNAWESMRDHSAYLLNAHRAPGQLRYPNIQFIRDPRTAVQLIKDGGYATSSTYVDSVMNVIDTYHLTDWDLR